MSDVLPAFIGPVAVLLGVWLGSHVNARNEARRWRRDTKAAAYRAFLRVAHEVQSLERELLLLSVRNAPGDLQDRLKERLETAAERMEFEAAELQLVASPEVLVAFLSITGRARPTMIPEVSRRDPPPAPEAVESALAETSRRHAALVHAMQADVGLLPSRRSALQAAVEADRY